MTNSISPMAQNRDSEREPVIVWTLNVDDGKPCEWHVDIDIDDPRVEHCGATAVWRAEVAGINGEWDVCAEHLAVAVLDLVTP